MIELSLSEYCIAVIIGAIVLIGFFGWVSRFAHHNEERRGRRVRLVCDLCLTAWENRSREKVVDCPHCGRKCRKAR
jgi:hypothetical protein